MPPDSSMPVAERLPHPDDVRAYVDYLRDLGIYDLIASPSAVADAATSSWSAANLYRSSPAPRAGASATRSNAGSHSQPVVSPVTPIRPTAEARPTPVSPFEQAQRRRAVGVTPTPPRPGAAPEILIASPLVASTPPVPAPASSQLLSNTPVSSAQTVSMPAPTPFNLLAPLPVERIAPANKPEALAALRNHIGDCTRCPLAYAGRHSIVFADGDANARLLFVGEGPGADEDEQGLPFVGKAGQLLNNMIQAMGLRREQVYIANVVKCRPPKNRTPEPVEANTCSPFLLQQIDIVQPEVIVALGATAATYLLGVKQSLSSLRGQWFNVRGAKCAVTYHPAFLLRDPRQKGEAWKDLQRVMIELKLKPPARA